MNSSNAPTVREVVLNVRTGLRTKAELVRCGCPTCREALQVLKGGQ